VGYAKSSTQSARRGVQTQGKAGGGEPTFFWKQTQRRKLAKGRQIKQQVITRKKTDQLASTQWGTNQKKAFEREKFIGKAPPRKQLMAKKLVAGGGARAQENDSETDKTNDWMRKKGLRTSR